MNQIEKMETDGTINNYVKQEQSMLRREAARFTKNLDGIRAMEKYPAAMFIIDLKREHNAVAEGRRLKIPIVAIVDTNSAARADFESRASRRKTEETTPETPAPAEVPASEAAAVGAPA
jgi:ribosomal protein S2